MSAKKFVPLAAMGDLEQERVIWRANLPDYAPSENITINLDKLARLARLGGMESIRVESYVGDTTQIVPEVNSVDQHGVASASKKASISKAKTLKTEVGGALDIEVPYDYRWQLGKISLNIAEIDERVAQKGNLRDADAWSKELDKALRKGMVKNSWDSLVVGPPISGKVKPLSDLSLVTLTAAILGRSGPELAAGVAQSYIALSLVGDHLLSKVTGILPEDVKFSDRKHTLMRGFALDRHMAVRTLASYGRIAKPLKSA